MSTEFRIDLSIPIAKAKKAAEDNLVEAIRQSAQSVARTLMSDGRYSAGGKEGLAHEILRKKIEDYVLSDDYAKKIDSIIIDVVDEEATKAVRVLLNSKSRKHLFEPTHTE